MGYPKGTRFNHWLINQENQKGIERSVIKRWVYYPDGSKKLERLPTSKYRSFRDDEAELQKFVIRLNEQIDPEQRTKAVVEIKHAFISPELLDQYKDFLLIQIPNRAKATNEYHYLVTYFLNFFIGKLGLANPLDWHLCHKTRWATYLVSKEAPSSGSTKKAIVAAANRFILWLHERRPGEVPPLKFTPLSKAKYKEIEAKRILNKEARETKMIKDEHWAIIRTKLPDSIRAFVMISYHYGLRRAESLGLQLEDVREGFLSVERQLESFTDDIPVYGPPKGREARKVPHWNNTATDVYNWIKEIQLMHPDTLSARWAELMRKLKLDYTHHDLRHTWVTKALRKQAVARDVQLAAGHKDLRTTMGYAHDDRTLSDRKFIPA